MAKMPTSVVDLVGERERLARSRWPAAHRPRSAAGSAPRSRGHLLRLALGERVVAAHDALKLRELADHGGQQVALGELGGALGCRAARHRCAAADAAPPAPRGARLVRLAAELRLEGDARERLRARAASGRGDPAPRRRPHRPAAAAPRARCPRAPRSGSRLSMLLTVMKPPVQRAVARPRSRNSAGDPGCVAITTSRGSSRKRGSKRPAIGTGHSTSAVTSSSSASLDHGAAAGRSPPALSTCARMRARRAREIAPSTLRARAALLVAARRFERAAAPAPWKRWPRRDAARARVPAASPARPPRRTAAPRQCTGRTNSALRAPQRMRRGDRQRRDRLLDQAAAAAPRSRAPRSRPRNTSHRAPVAVAPLERLDVARRNCARRRVAARVGAPARIERDRHRRTAPLDLLIRLRAGAGADTSTARRRGVAKLARARCATPACVQPFDEPSASACSSALQRSRRQLLRAAARPADSRATRSCATGRSARASLGLSSGKPSASRLSQVRLARPPARVRAPAG